MRDGCWLGEDADNIDRLNDQDMQADDLHTCVGSFPKEGATLPGLTSTRIGCFSALRACTGSDRVAFLR